ncbi:hypothetical protein F5Y17DRAFT_457489 [Xylariaceae sp. FL0594]|nr:hypothetical protein F5Y17DRAFT_457489 [Xylariaceae sp. FL0594]
MTLVDSCSTESLDDRKTPDTTHSERSPATSPVRKIHPLLKDTSLVAGYKRWPHTAFIGFDKNIPAIYRATAPREAHVELATKPKEFRAQVRVIRDTDKGGSIYFFSMALGGREGYFAWRRSNKSTVNNLQLDCQGYELLRLDSTGTQSTDDNVRLVATCATSSKLHQRTMVLRYIASFGYEWEVISLVTLLVLWLSDRKHRRAQS